GIAGVFGVEPLAAAAEDRPWTAPALRIAERAVEGLRCTVKDVVARRFRRAVLAAPPHPLAVALDHRGRAVVVRRVRPPCRDDVAALPVVRRAQLALGLDLTLCRLLSRLLTRHLDGVRLRRLCFGDVAVTTS